MNSQNKTLSKHWFLNNIFGIVFLSIYFDGLCDNYLLFDTLLVFKKENNRDFWNDWE